jgi:hypothetical protein
VETDIKASILNRDYEPVQQNDSSGKNNLAKLFGLIVFFHDALIKKAESKLWMELKI